MSEKQYVFLGFICLLIGLLEGLYAGIMNELAVRGELYTKLQTDIYKTRLENQNLRNQILYEQSYTRIYLQETEQGYIAVKYKTL